MEWVAIFEGGEPIAYRLLGPHINAALNGLDGVLQSWKPSLVVVLDHSNVWRQVKAASPHTVFVGRVPQPSEPNFNDPGLDPLRAARACCEKILPQADRMGKTYDFWQGVNEPVIQSAEAMRRFADFESERARILSGRGFQAAVGSFSVGNPAQLALWSQFVPALEAAHQLKGVLALHEYAWPTLDHESPWYLLRHRKVYNGEPAHGWQGLPAHLKRLPLLITECGLDGLIERANPPRGWQIRYGQDPTRYLQDLAWYDAELQKDPYVVGAALYCCCTSDDPQWASYNIWPALFRALAQQARPLYRLAQLLEPERPSPKPTPSPAPKDPPPAQPPKGAEPPAEQPAQPPTSGVLPSPPLLPPPSEEPSQPGPGKQGPGGGRGRYILSAAVPGTPPQPDGIVLPLAAGAAAMTVEKMQQVRERSDRILALLQRDHVSGGRESTSRSTAMRLQVLDQQGQERDTDWLVTNFGLVHVEQAQVTGAVAKVYRLVWLRDVAGPAALVVKVLDEQGQPLPGVHVVRSWPNAPELPAWPSPASRWQGRGVFGPTGKAGSLAFGLGAGDYYSLPDGGPASVWVAGPAGPSDLVTGLGMLDAAGHRHLDLCYRLEAAAPAAQPATASLSLAGSAAAATGSPLPPALPSLLPVLTGDQCKLLNDRLDQILQALEERLSDPSRPA